MRMPTLKGIKSTFSRVYGRELTEHEGKVLGFLYNGEKVSDAIASFDEVAREKKAERIAKLQTELEVLGG